MKIDRKEYFDLLRSLKEGDSLAEEKIFGYHNELIDILGEKNEYNNFYSEIAEIYDFPIEHLDGVILPTGAIDKGDGDGDIVNSEPGYSTYPKFLAIMQLLEAMGYDKGVQVYTGNVEKNLMRKVGYAYIKIPAVKKSIFVNDGYGEATFVCHGMPSIEEIQIFTKEELQSKYNLDLISFSVDKVQSWLQQISNALNSKDGLLHKNSTETENKDRWKNFLNHEDFEKRYMTLLSKKGRMEDKNFGDVRGGILYLRRYNLISRAVLKAQNKAVKDINPRTIKPQINGELKSKIKISSLTYADATSIFPKLENIDIEKYDTEDGQIQWLIDNGYTDIHLGSFSSVIPKELKSKLTNWNTINLPIKTAIEIRKKLESIDIQKYNTEDGQIQWLIDNGYTDINLGHFSSVIPKELKSKLTNWNTINLPIKTAIEIRKKLESIDIQKYNTEDGQIQWLIDNGYTDIYLGHFSSVIPKELKSKLTNWNKIDLPIKTAIEIRKKLESIDIQKYNTEDGQIQWLIDNGYTDIHLGHFSSVIPKELKSKLTNWNKIDLPIKKAIEIRNKLENIDIEKYNTEDGQIQWLIDNGYTDINLGNFSSVIPKELKSKLNNWNTINLPIKTALEIRQKLESIDIKKYNTEDGQIEWLIDNGYTDIHLGHFSTVIPKELKYKLNNWNSIILPIKTAIEIRKKLDEIIGDKEKMDKYNVSFGYLDFLKDHGYEGTNIAHFFTAVPTSVEEKMTEWKPFYGTFEEAEEERGKK